MHIIIFVKRFSDKRFFSLKLILTFDWKLKKILQLTYLKCKNVLMQYALSDIGVL